MASPPVSPMAAASSLLNQGKSAVAATVARGGLIAAGASAIANSSLGRLATTTGKILLGFQAARELTRGIDGQTVAASDGLNYTGGVLPGIQAALQKDGAYKHKIFFVNNFRDVKDPIWVTAWLPEQVSLDISATYQRAFGEGLLSGGGVVNNSMKAFGFSGVSREMSFKVWESTQGITMQVPLIFSLDDTRPAGDSDRDLHAAILKLQKLVAPSQTQTDGKKNLFLTPPGATYRVKRSESETTGTVTQTGDAPNNALVAPQTSVDTAQTEDTGSFGGDLVNVLTSTFDVLSGGVKALATGKGIAGTINAIGQELQSLIDNDLELLTWTSVYIGNFLYFKEVVIDSVSTAYDMRLDADGRPIRATVNVQFTTLFDVTVQDLNAIYKIPSATQTTANKSPTT